MGFINNTKIELTRFQERLLRELKNNPEGIYRDDLCLLAYDCVDEYALAALKQHIYKLNKRIIDMKLGKIKYIGYKNSTKGKGKLVKLILTERNTNE